MEDKAMEAQQRKTDRGDNVDALEAGEGDSIDTFGAQGARGGEGAVGGREVTMTRGQFDSDCYNMDHKRRGKAIIFNNRKFQPSTGMGERTGTDIDTENLFMILSEIGFDVTTLHDQTIREMKSALEKAARENHSDADCFACAILSHGEEGYVYGFDGPVEIEQLVAPFKGNRCRTLAGKPKLFFIQACRGSKLDDGVEVCDAVGGSVEDMETDVEVRRIPTEADFLLAYSVVPGFYSWRNSFQGSWFIQALVDVLRENWRRMELMSMMTRVCRKVAYDFESNASREYMRYKKQIPCITSMLTRDVYFTPKK